MRTVRLLITGILATLMSLQCSVDPLTSTSGGTHPITPPAYYNKIIANSFLGCTGNDNSSAATSFKIVRIDGTTGSVTPIGGYDYFTSLAYSPYGTLYGISDELRIIDPASGNTTLMGTFRYPSDSIVLMGGGGFTPDGILYVAANAGTPTGGRRIFTVNVNTATLSYVGMGQYVGTTNIEFNSTNTMYSGTSSLLILNPVSLNATVVGTFGSAWMSKFRCISDSKAIGIDISNTAATLYTINLSTAGTTVIHTLQYPTISGFTPERSATPVAKKAFSDALAKQGNPPEKTLAQLIDLEKRYREGR